MSQAAGDTHLDFNGILGSSCCNVLIIMKTSVLARTIHIKLFVGHLAELTTTAKITELQHYLMTRYSNQSFWVGASDLEAAGTFRWFYSGDQFSSDLWSSNPISGRHCVHFNENFLKFSAAKCDNKNYFICEVEIFITRIFVRKVFSVHPRDLHSH